MQRRQQEHAKPTACGSPRPTRAEGSAGRSGGLESRGAAIRQLHRTGRNRAPAARRCGGRVCYDRGAPGDGRAPRASTAETRRTSSSNSMSGTDPGDPDQDDPDRSRGGVSPAGALSGPLRPAMARRAGSSSRLIPRRPGRNTSQWCCGASSPTSADGTRMPPRYALSRGQAVPQLDSDWIWGRPWHLHRRGPFRGPLPGLWRSCLRPFPRIRRSEEHWTVTGAVTSRSRRGARGLSARPWSPVGLANE